ncbi:EF-hand calcium-binding domain-containing protein 3-like [Colossoma macropomum]|uniref:EF-hand calcium-binding domain-containing protein 3-like n=1 Tax=Colossoma macropomum TaxID=42526 RepID=UPI001865359F|nr:EF-hand calcium-binding domain-containing protein 3-like [Colossoma macropomum]
MQEERGWKEAAQRRASQFLTRITPRQRFSSYSEPESENTEVTVEASTNDPDESAQRSRAESQQTTPTNSPEIDQPDVKDMSEVSEEDSTATSVEDHLDFIDLLSGHGEVELDEKFIGHAVTEKSHVHDEIRVHNPGPVTAVLRETHFELQNPPDAVEPAALSGPSLEPRQDINSSHTSPNTTGQPRSISTFLGRMFQKDTPKKLIQMTAESVTGKLGKKRVTEHQELKTSLPVSPISNKDLEEFLQSLGIDQVEDLPSVVQDEPLTEAQTNAFRTVFECFDKDSQGCIDAEALRSTLESVGISISSEEVQTALKRADYDEDGVVGFHDFLSVMTDCQQFSKCVEAEGADGVDLSEKVFYVALAKLLNAGSLPRSTAGEIVQFYHTKILRLIRQTARLDDDSGHIITYYSRGAHLLGLNCKQLMKYMKPLKEKSSQKKSPYLKHPSVKVDYTHMHMSLHHGVLTPVGRVKTTKTWKTVEIEDRLRKLSIKHPGMETKEMITPVQIKVNLTLKERDHLSFDQIKQIESMSQSGLNQYLKTLALYKRRDFWNSWRSLQTYCRMHRCKHFPQTFSTYSWSWSTCRNMIEVTELLQSKESPGHALEKLPPMQKKSTQR